MSPCAICFLRRLFCTRVDSPGHGHLVTSNLTGELEDSHRFTLNVIMALLAILAAPGLKALQPMTLPLLMYTTTLRLATYSCCLRNHPTLSRFLHSIPLLGTSCMAGVALVIELQSPTLATVGIVLGTFPLLTFMIHHESRCGEASADGLPMQMQDIRAPAGLGVGDRPDGGELTP